MLYPWQMHDRLNESSIKIVKKLSDQFRLSGNYDNYIIQFNADDDSGSASICVVDPYYNTNIHKFMFFPNNSNNNINNIAIYGVQLSEQYQVIRNSKNIFGFRVAEISLETENTVNPFIDVYIEDYKIPFALSILEESFSNLQKRIGNLSIESIEEEVINQACKYILENHRSELTMVHDISQIGLMRYENAKFHNTIKDFVDAAAMLYPNDYKDAEGSAAINGILNNISWAGMWEHLRRYFLQKHGIRIDNVVSEENLLTFSSQKHLRFENGIKMRESNEPRVVSLTFSNNRRNLLISIEPSLSAKSGNLIGKQNNKLTYLGDDPDYRFIVELDEFEEVEMFILEMPARNLRLEYY